MWAHKVHNNQSNVYHIFWSSHSIECLSSESQNVVKFDRFFFIIEQYLFWISSKAWPDWKFRLKKQNSSTSWPIMNIFCIDINSSIIDFFLNSRLGTLFDIGSIILYGHSFEKKNEFLALLTLSRCKMQSLKMFNGYNVALFLEFIPAYLVHWNLFLCQGMGVH